MAALEKVMLTDDGAPADAAPAVTVATGEDAAAGAAALADGFRSLCGFDDGKAAADVDEEPDLKGLLEATVAQSPRRRRRGRPALQSRMPVSRDAEI